MFYWFTTEQKIGKGWSEINYMLCYAKNIKSYLFKKTTTNKRVKTRGLAGKGREIIGWVDEK